MAEALVPERPHREREPVASMRADYPLESLEARRRLGLPALREGALRAEGLELLEMGLEGRVDSTKCVA